MITKAYIQEVLSPNKVRIRIPLYHKIEEVNGATSNSYLPVASFNVPPGTKLNPKTGDIVIVSFEEDDVSKPIILGYLLLSNQPNTELDVICDYLKASGKVELSKDITVGDIKYENIFCLKNQKTNIPEDFKILSDRTSKLETEIEKHSTSLSTLENDLENFKIDTNSNIGNINNKLDIAQTKIDELFDKFNDYVQKFPAIFSGSYGKSIRDVQNPQEGQVYFTIKEDN